jgi:hypothetical protein
MQTRFINNTLKKRFPQKFLDYKLSNFPGFSNFWQEYCYEKLDVEDFRIIRNSGWYQSLGIDEAGSAKPYQNPRIQSCISRYLHRLVWEFVDERFTIYDFLSRVESFLIYDSKVMETDLFKVIIKLANFLYGKYEQDNLVQEYFSD